MNKKIFKSAFFTYESQGTIGNGGGGSVYKVNCIENNCFYALKLITKDASIEKISRFKNEFSFMLHANHNNILRPFDSGEYEGLLFYVMPLAESALTPLMGKSSPELCCKIAIDLIDALAYLHEKNVIHRDLKPENILMIKGKPQICDFGIAHLLEGDQISPVHTEKGERMANFRYASPEQRSKNPHPASTMDIYSLGIIIHELFTNEFIQGEKSKKIADLYPEYGYWDDIVDKCIKNEPAQRFISAVELKNNFDMFRWNIKFPISDFRSEAIHFAYDRFTQAFPEAVTIQTITEKEEITARLKVLLRPPYKIGAFDCVWWSQGICDNPVNKFAEDKDSGVLYIGELECCVNKIASLNFGIDFKNCVYVEVEALPAIFSNSDVNIQPQMEEFAKYRENYYPVSVIDNGYLWDNCKQIEINKEEVIYGSRFLKKSNFLLLSRQNSIMQCTDKYNVDALLKDILSGHKNISDLYNFIQRLPKPNFY